MTPQDDDMSKIEADDALLSAIASSGSAGDDAAGRLLADIAETTKGLSPRDTPGGASRRIPRRRGGLWGVSLGVSIVVAAGGGLSAAATDRLPEPVQRFVVEVGQAVPPAAAQVVATPTEAPPPSTPAPAAVEPAALPRSGSWLPRRDQPGRPSTAWAGTAGGVDTSAPQKQWWASWTSEHQSRYPSHSTFPSSTSSPEPTPTSDPSMGDHTTAPTAPTSYPHYYSYPVPAYRPPTSTPAPSSEPDPTSSPQPQRTWSGHPSPSPSTSHGWHTASPAPWPTSSPAAP